MIHPGDLEKFVKIVKIFLVLGIINFAFKLGRTAYFILITPAD
jgi:hypothetical protein